MPLFDPFFRRYLRFVFTTADRLVSRDALHGYISDENDFTSNLTLRIRDLFKLRKHIGVSSYYKASFSVCSRKLKPNLERHFGSDACILLVDYSSNQFKVCFFEAKSNRNNWDTYSSSQSHFSSQIIRQSRAIARGYAVWEQFYPHIYPNKPLSPHRNQSGSTCITYSNAYYYMCNNVHNRAWNDLDIDNLCQYQKKLNLSIDMGEMVFLASECFIGKPQIIDTDFSINRYLESLDLEDVDVVMAIEYGTKDFDNFKTD